MMEKSIKLIKKIIVLIITVVLLLMFNRHIALPFENFLVQNYKAIVSYGLKIIFITDILWICYDILRSVTFKMAQGLWHSTLNVLKVGIKQSEDFSEKLSTKEKYAELIIPQCLGLSLTHNEGYPQIDLIGEMKQRFEDDSVSMLDKEEIAYLILSNKSNRSIAEFCSTPHGSEFFLSCERVSQAVIRRSTFSCKSLSFDSSEFRSITNEFLHIGLAYGTINTDERIDYIRKVLSWVRQEIKNKSSIESQYFQKFILALSKIENTLIYHNLKDELIDIYIKQIKKSWYFKRMYWNANKRLWLKKYHTTLTDRACDAGFIIAYSRKFGVFYRLALYRAISAKLREYRRIYHENYRDAVMILVLAVPLGNMESPNNDYADNLLTVINAFGGIK